MFGDNVDELTEEVEKALEVYSFDDILDHNELTIVDVLTTLLMEGHIVLPETTPV